MKLPQAFLLRKVLQRIRVLNPRVRLVILLSGAIIAALALVLPVVYFSVRQAKPAVSTPPAIATVSPLQPTEKEPQSEPAKPAPATPAPAKVEVKAAKTLSIQDFHQPLAGKELRGTSKTLIWWDVLGDYRLHPGVDIGVSAGSIVRAAAGGTVTELGADPVFGKVLVLDHGSGWQTVYGQLDNLKVQLKAKVQSGQELGSVGLPVGGEADLAPHLHYEIRHNGLIVNGLNGPQ